MKRSYSTILRSLLCVAVLAFGAVAADDVKYEDVPTPGEPSDITPAANCDLTGYKLGEQTFPTPVPIPDNQAVGVTVGPIVIADDGTLIADVIIDLNLAHTWIGDITATVGYDANCDGAIDVSSVIICRPGSTLCSGTAVGCSSNFICANRLLIDDTAAAGIPSTSCLSTTNVAAGCYRPTGSTVGNLDVFNNLRKGGCWYLHVSDRAGLDVGTICGWSVHLLNQGEVGVEPTSWSAAKQLFN